MTIEERFKFFSALVYQHDLTPHDVARREDKSIDHFVFNKVADGMYPCVIAGELVVYRVRDGAIDKINAHITLDNNTTLPEDFEQLDRERVTYYSASCVRREIDGTPRYGLSARSTPKKSLKDSCAYVRNLIDKQPELRHDEFAVIKRIEHVFTLKKKQKGKR